MHRTTKENPCILNMPNHYFQYVQLLWARTESMSEPNKGASYYISYVPSNREMRWKRKNLLKDIRRLNDPHNYFTVICTNAISYPSASITNYKPGHLCSVEPHKASRYFSAACKIPHWKWLFTSGAARWCINAVFLLIPLPFTNQISDISAQMGW